MVSYGYQGAFAEEFYELDLAYNEFFLRTYDPQTGRFIQADPFDQFPSPYLGMGNDPVSLVDPSGGGVETTLLGRTTGADAVVTAAAKTAGRFATATLVSITGSVISLGVNAAHLYSTIDGAAQFRNTKDLGLWYDDPETGLTFGREDAFGTP